MKKNYSSSSLIPAFPRLFFLITIVFVLPIKAQIYTPSGTIQGTSNTNNVGIGTANPIGKLEVVTGGPGITYDVVSQTNGSVSFANFSSSLTAPVISGKSNNNSGLVLMAASNAGNSNADMRFDIRENDNSPFTDLTPIGFRFQHFGTSLIDILRNGNVGIGTATPIGKLQINTGLSGITFDMASQAIGSFSFNNSSTINTVPTISSKSDNSVGLALISGTNDSNGNPDMLLNVRRNSGSDYATLTSTAFRFSRLSTSLVEILRNGNVGIGATNPQNKLQIGEFNTSNTSKLSIPGVYNFEEIKLGQYGNGKNGLEMISHTNSTQSFGVRFYSGVDTGTNGLLIQTADPANSAGELAYTSKMVVTLNGNVGIGITTPNNKLDVNGTIHSKEVKVDLNFPADYVFQKYYSGKSELKPDYTLLSLSEIEKFTKENHHLPNVPSAKEIQENGLQLGEMSNILLQKIEELTLYSIEQQKTIQKQAASIERLEKENAAFKKLEERLGRIEKDLEVKK